MSKAQLKKHLLKLTQEEVIDVILELYDARKEAKEYLEFYMNPKAERYNTTLCHCVKRTVGSTVITS